MKAVKCSLISAGAALLLLGLSAPLSFAGGAKESSSSGTTTITYMNITARSNVGSSAYATGLYGAIDDYMAKHPNIKIVSESLDQTSYQTKIQALAAANDLPDIFDLKGSWVSIFANNGWAVDLAPWVNADAKWKNGFTPGSFAPVIRGDKIYGVPSQGFITSIVFWNSALWQSIGYSDFPKTWPELLDAVQKFRANNIVPFVMGNLPNWPAESCWLSTLGDRLTGTAWTQSIIAKSGAKFTDPDFVAALKTFQDLATAGAFNKDINSLDVDPARQVYYDGKAAAFVDGSWSISAIASQAPADVKNATRVAILPSVPGGKGDPNTASGGPAWFNAMGASVKDPARQNAVVDVIRAITDGRQTAITASLGGVVAYTDITFDSSKLPPLMVAFNGLMKNVKPVPIYDAYMDAAVIQTMNVGLQSLLIGAVTPEALAEQIQAAEDKVSAN